MSYSKSLKISAQAERARDIVWENYCAEEDEYEDECDRRYNNLYKELKSRKSELIEDELEYEALSEYLRDYDITPDTELQEVIDSFVDEIDN